MNVSWDDDIPIYYGKVIKHVPNHQPVMNEAPWFLIESQHHPNYAQFPREPDRATKHHFPTLHGKKQNKEWNRNHFPRSLHWLSDCQFLHSCQLKAQSFRSSQSTFFYPQKNDDRFSVQWKMLYPPVMKHGKKILHLWYVKDYFPIESSI